MEYTVCTYCGKYCLKFKHYVTEIVTQIEKLPNRFNSLDAYHFLTIATHCKILIIRISVYNKDTCFNATELR